MYQPKRDCVPGFVYLAQSRSQYKIGFSKDPVRRMFAARVEVWPCDHDDLRLIHVIPTNNMAMAEIKLHQMFTQRRVKNDYRCEWFFLLPEEVTQILSLGKLEV